LIAVAEGEKRREGKKGIYSRLPPRPELIAEIARREKLYIVKIERRGGAFSIPRKGKRGEHIYSRGRNLGDVHQKRQGIASRTKSALLGKKKVVSKRGQVISINCSAIPEERIKGRKVGHEKGAFTFFLWRGGIVKFRVGTTGGGISIKSKNGRSSSSNISCDQ